MNKHTATLMMTTLALACAQAFADEPAFEQPKAADYVPSGSRAAAEDKAAQTQEEGGNLPLKYPVEIRTDNSEVKAMLQEYLPLITQQQQEVLDQIGRAHV